MKRNTLIGSIAAGVLVVGAGVGAAIATTQISAADPTPTVTSSEILTDEASPTPTPTLPLTAETPDAAPADKIDAEFAAYVRSQLQWDTGIADASDEALVDAGKEACELLLAGTDSESIRLVDGEEPSASGYYSDTGAIIDGARRFYCPETIY